MVVYLDIPLVESMAVYLVVCLAYWKAARLVSLMVVCLVVLMEATLAVHWENTRVGHSVSHSAG